MPRPYNPAHVTSNSYLSELDLGELVSLSQSQGYVGQLVVPIDIILVVLGLCL